MRNLSLDFLRFSWVALLALPFAAAGCLGDGSESLPSGPSGSVTSPPVGHQAFREYILHVQPKAKRATLHLVPISRDGAPSLSPQALIDANLCSDGTTGSNDPTLCGFAAGTQTVELVTDSNSIVDTFGTAASGSCPANSFCADVTLNSFWTNPLNFTNAQITAITDASGTALSGHSATNSDSAGRTGLSTSLGLWQYQSASVTTGGHFANGSTGVMLSGSANGAKKTWVFANPDDADTYVRIRVMAAQTYSSYALTTGSKIGSYSDACTGGTQIELDAGGFPLTQPANTNSVASFIVPFGFTFWGTRYDSTKTWTVTKWGNMGLGSVAASTSNTNVALPSTSAPHPGVFVFWDKLVWSNTAPRGLCAKTTGTAPNRQLYVSWKNVAYTGSGSPMTFEVVFNEGSEEIWYIYQTMVGASQAGGATVGAQNEAGTTAASGGDAAANTTSHLQLASGTKLVLQPSP